MSAMDSENLAPTPPAEGEWSLAKVADWGPTEDWTDWLDAAGND